MSQNLTLPKYSLGVGDRFAHQASAQFSACILALNAGVEVIPVWNKSNREHNIIGSEPSQTRSAVDLAVRESGWMLPYFLDADHIGLATVDRFLAPCDFFTIDVAEEIGKPASAESLEAFLGRHPELLAELHIPGIPTGLHQDRAFATATANKFLAAVQQAGKVYRAIAAKKGEGTFVTEISMDETDSPQSPAELLIILAAIADECIPIQTIAPKFSGRFNKGVDYVGDVARFTLEFESDLAIIQFAIKAYGLPPNLKLSVHSGSDKFSIYPAIHNSIIKHNAGVHVKTAGTSWLEEVIGLAEGSDSGLEVAKHLYAEAFVHQGELRKPYAAVIDIDESKLPAPTEVATWSGERFASALRHDPSNPAYDANMRQLLHVGFKMAAKMGEEYLSAIRKDKASIAANVTGNLYNRHIRPIFLGTTAQ